MNEIIPLLMCIEGQIGVRELRHLRHIIMAMLCVPNRATMLGLSKWTEKGGSYRTLNRFYQSPLDWLSLHWCLLQSHVLSGDREYILAGDEVVISKAGKKTHGVGRFFSGLAQRVIPGLSFMTISVIDVEAGRSFPLYTRQIMPVAKVKESVPETAKRERGRPKGSKNHSKPAPSLSPLLTLFQEMLNKILLQIKVLKVKHIVLDGNFGNYPCTWMITQQSLHIVSKMRHNAALYLPYQGEPPRRGPCKRYGEKLDYSHLPAENLVETTIEDHIRTEIYHLQAYHHDYPDLLNIVVIVKTHLTTHKRAHVVLFSTDCALTADKIIRFYRLRFQIEFNFRDAKQYWGLEDFMNVTPLAVTNAVNLAFFMVNLSHIMIQPLRQHHPDFSVLDLKADFRARRYLAETIKLLPELPQPDLISRIWQRLTRFGGIRSRLDHSFVP
jgi:putative transposase